MRLIDVDAASEIVRFECGKLEWLANTIIKEFYALKPVDTVPVRHGRWEWDGEAFVCSACGSGYEGQPTMMGKPMFEFCPVCGADMRKDGDDGKTD